MEIANNSVSAKNQVEEYDIVRVKSRGGKKRVLFVGNSITRHAPAPEIGWLPDWGMAASAEENDYVHVAVRLIEEKLGEKIDYATACCGDWERNYWDDEQISRWQEASDFKADVLVIRIGENIWGQREKLGTLPLYPHFDKMVKFFRSNPNAKVIITDLFWSYDGIDDVIYKVAADNGYTLVKIGDIGAKDENKALGQFEHSGVAIHPNDRGMAAIAERIVDEI